MNTPLRRHAQNPFPEKAVKFLADHGFCCPPPPKIQTSRVPDCTPGWKKINCDWDICSRLVKKMIWGEKGMSRMSHRKKKSTFSFPFQEKMFDRKLNEQTSKIQSSMVFSTCWMLSLCCFRVLLTVRSAPAGVAYRCTTDGPFCMTVLSGPLLVNPDMSCLHAENGHFGNGAPSGSEDTLHRPPEIPN